MLCRAAARARLAHGVNTLTLPPAQSEGAQWVQAGAPGIDRNPPPLRLQPTALSAAELDSFREVQERIASGRIECMKG